MPGPGSVCAQGQESERARAGLNLAWGLGSCSDWGQDSVMGQKLTASTYIAFPIISIPHQIVTLPTADEHTCCC